MRWEQLFAELEAQFAAELEADAGAESASRARAEQGQVRLAERIAGGPEQLVTLRCRGAGDVAGRLVDVGVDWVLLVDGAAEVLVALGAVVAVGGLGARTAPHPGDGAVRVRMDLRRAIRALVRDRQTVLLTMDDGSRWSGTLDRVGADFVELAEHPVDEPRRRAAVRGVRALALPAVAVVRSVTPALD